MALQIGFGLITAQVPPWASHDVTDEYSDVLAMSRLVEDLGFDSVWVSEHHLTEDSYLPSVLPLLAAIAALTERVTLGTAIALAPLHDPLRFAEDSAVVDLLARGRLMLGLGAGWRKKEFETFGVPASERGRRTQQLVDICRRAWGPVREGDDVSLASPKPERLIPLLLGGTATPPIERAGRLGDGYIGTPQNNLEAFRAAVNVFDEAARGAGRDPSGLSLALHVNAWVSGDGAIPEPVLRAMWHQIGAYARWHAEDDGVAGAASAFPPMDLERLQSRTVSGTPGQVVEQLAPWVSEFAEREFHMIFRLHYPGMRLTDAEPAVRMFAEQVVPELRSLSP